MNEIKNQTTYNKPSWTIRLLQNSKRQNRRSC